MTAMKMFLLAVLAVLPLAYTNPTPSLLKVGAFNIQVFGPTKASKEDVMGYISQIVSQYDIILIQEIRDKSGGCMETLLNLLNEGGSDEFNYVVSERLGRTFSKEQYAYYYKTDKVRILATRQFNDTEDVFEREPFSVLIEADTTGGVMEMSLTGVHIKPSDALNEIKHMEDVYVDAKSFFNTENMLIMGDMNADCSYLSLSEIQQTKLFTESKYLPVILNEEDTTTSNTDCSYDRIVVAGQELQDRVYSHGIEHFEEEFGLNNDEMKAISDHYPVMINLRLDL